MPDTSHAVEVLFQRKLFDPVWYRETYPDVGLLGMEPDYHYRNYGYLMNRAPAAEFADDPHILEAILLPPPDKGRALLAAHEIARGGKHGLAISYATVHLPEGFEYTLRVLEANRAVAEHDDGKWLEALNSYLANFDVAQVKLGAGDSKMSRLIVDPLPPVNDGPLVTIIMTVWNAEKTIDYAIRSVLAQTWRNIELIIVDDVSTDNTPAIVRDFASKDNRIRVFRNSVNVGPYVSRNVAVTQARGDWITCHDADDWAHPERIALQIHFCIEQKTPVSMSGMVRMAEDGQFVRLNKVGGFVHDGACRSAFVSMMIESNYFHDLLGYWDPVRVGADSELLGRIEHLRRKPVPALPTLTMLCLDNPEGLTNHPTLGYSETVGVSPYARAYIDAFRAFHKKTDRTTSRITDPAAPIRYPVPQEMLNAPGVTERLFRDYQADNVLSEVDIKTEISIATHLPFTGGSSSSTVDELAWLDNHGKSVALINCPVDNELGFSIFNRFLPWKDNTTSWARLGHLDAKVFICRHPRVVLSAAFRNIAPRIKADTTFIVVNNSYLRATGEVVYDRRALVSAAKRINTGNLIFCPISPAIRAELEEYRRKSGDLFTISDMDWNPTFESTLYYNPPKDKMEKPFRIGRHSRDGYEKWLEQPSLLTQAFPTHDDFTISILGGAQQAIKFLGETPKNWRVLEFGEIEPLEYLRDLDVFVYFPHTGLTEAFGRTIPEAMIAARPVIVPHSFKRIFGDLPIYAEPGQVEKIVRALAGEDEARVAYLTEVQRIVTARYGSRAIGRRLAGTGLNLADETRDALSLSPDALKFKRRMEALGRK